MLVIKKDKIVEVVAGHAVLRAHPALFRLLAVKEAEGRCDEILVGAPRKVRDYVNVQIIDPSADVFPSFAAVETPNDAAMFETQIDRARIFRVDMDVAHVAVVRRLGIPPVLAHAMREGF